MSFNFSALKTESLVEDSNLRVSKTMAAFIVARALAISVVVAIRVLDDNFPAFSTYSPGQIGELIRDYFMEEPGLGDPDEHNGE